MYGFPLLRTYNMLISRVWSGSKVLVRMGSFRDGLSSWDLTVLPEAEGWILLHIHAYQGSLAKVLASSVCTCTPYIPERWLTRRRVTEAKVRDVWNLN